MIAMTISSLIAALVVVAIFQPSASRLMAALIFAGVILTFELFFSEYGGFIYYGGAALSNFLVILLTSFINPLSKMILRLQIVCTCMLLANLAGFLIWFFYFPPFVYDLTFAILFSCALYAFIDRENDRWFYVGGFTLTSWSSCFSIRNFTSFRNNKANKG